MTTLSGPAWVENRRFCLRVLKDLGFGKKSMEEHIKEELRYLIARLVDAKGSPVPIREHLIPSTSNVITALLFGTTYSFDDPKRKYLDKLLARLFKIIMSGSAVDFQPYWLRKVAARIPYTRSYALRKASLDLHAFIRERVKEHQETIDPNFHRDFIDGYLNKVTEHQDNPNSHFRALLFGTTYSFDDPKRKYLDKLLARLFKIIMSGSAVDFQPYWLRKIAARIPYTRSYALRKASLDLHAFIRERVKEHQETIDPNFHRDFIDGYLNKVTEHQDNPNSHFREAYILGNAIDFFVAGTGTVAASIQWHLFNCAKNPDTVQAVIQREIDGVIGREREPAWEDRSQMHFTMACIWEMLRWRTVVPLGLPRGTREDTFFDDYFIPKDTVVLANLLAVHRDPELWERPDEFDPTRFLKKDGTGLVKKPEHLIAFSVGKRMCPAEALTTVEIFLYLTTFLQKFRVLPAEGQQLPNLSSPALTVAHPSLQRLRFLPR
ncbi:putative cytochrome P450 [Ixodes scapularis]